MFDFKKMNPFIVAPILCFLLFIGNFLMRKALQKDVEASQDFWQENENNPDFEEEQGSALSYNRDPLG